MADHSNITRRTIMKSAAFAVAPIAAVAVGRDNPDAELLRLGVAFDDAWARENDLYESDEWETAAEVTGGLVHRIEVAPARTLDGLKVKARALSWCHCGEPIDFRNGQDTTDARLANSIIAALLNA